MDWCTNGLMKKHARETRYFPHQSTCPLVHPSSPYFTLISSTSNVSVSSGPIGPPGVPRGPYASFDGI